MNFVPNTFKKKYISIVWIIMFVILIGLIIKNYSNRSKAILLNEQKNLLILVKVSAKNVENDILFENKKLRMLGSEISPYIRNDNSVILKKLTQYAKNNKDSVSNITFIDNSSKENYSYPSNIYTKSQIKHIILKENKNELIFQDEIPFLYITSVLFIDNEKVGVLQEKFKLNNIYNKYFKDIKIGKKGYLSVKNQNNIFIMHPKQNQIGKNALILRKQLLPSYNWRDLRNLFNLQHKGIPGVTLYDSIWVTDKVPHITKKFNAFAPIKFYNNTWVITASSDYNEVIEPLKYTYYSTIGILTLIFLILFIPLRYTYLLNEKEKRHDQEKKYFDKIKTLNTQLQKDLVKRKSLEEENKQKDLKLLQQSRQALMGEMIENIAHQWRQPISTLSILSANIKDAIIYNDPKEEVYKMLDRNKIIINKMSSTIEDFRDFFKPKTQKEMFYLKELSELILNICGERIKNNDIEFIFIDKQIKFYGYKNHLSQVLLNFVNNAIDSLKESKKDKKYIKIESFYKNNNNNNNKEVMISIIDNGNGIPKEIINNIFDPYFSTKTQKNGSGLGLYMSRTIIHQYFKGDIIVSSNENQTEFQLKFNNYNELK